MASIVKRGTNKYSVVYYEGEGDAKHQVWKSGLSLNEAEAFKDKLNLEDKKRKEIAKAEKKATATVTSMTLEEFMDDFVQTYGRKHWGSSYYSSNIALLNNYIYPYLGHLRIVDVTTKVIDDYYNFLVTECEPVNNPGQPKREHVSASQVHDIHKVLRTAFNQARRWKYITENPFVDADVPEYIAEERPAFSSEEIEMILEYTDEQDNYERYVIHVALCIQYFCTTRGGEVGTLQWSDYNRDAKTLHFYKAIARVKREHMKLPKLKIIYVFPTLNSNATTFIVLKSPKTEKTVRMSKIEGLLIEKLDHLRAMQQDMIKDIFGDYYPDSQLIICQANGRPLMPEQLNRKFKEIILEMRNAGYKFTSVPESELDDSVFHSVRATSATKKLTITGNIKDMMHAGGWATADMVIRCTRANANNQSRIAQCIEGDYLKSIKADDEANTATAENATRDQIALEYIKEDPERFIRENPEFVAKLLAASLANILPGA